MNPRLVTTVPGWKESGVGTRHGAGGIRKYCRPQTLMIARLVPSRDLFMYPARRSETWLLDALLRVTFGRGSRRRNLLLRENFESTTTKSHRQ